VARTAAAGEFEILSEAKVDQLSWYLVEKSQRCVNFGAVDMRDGASIELIPVRAEEAIDRFNKLARKDLGQRGSLESQKAQMIFGTRLSNGVDRRAAIRRAGEAAQHVELRVALTENGYRAQLLASFDLSKSRPRSTKLVGAGRPTRL
jgi:hypothetical protein